MSYGHLTTQDAIGTASAASVAVNYPTPTGLGNLLTATVYAFGLGVGAVSIAGWSTAVSVSFIAAADSTTILYKIADGTETSVSASSSGATSMGMAIHEFSSGKLQTVQTWLDQTNTSNTGSLVTTLGTGSITPTAVNELIVVAMSFPTGGTSSPSFDSGATTMSNNANMIDAFLVSLSKSAVSPTASWTGLSVAGGCIASFFPGSQADNPYNHVLVYDGTSRAEVAN